MALRPLLARCIVAVVALSAAGFSAASGSAAPQTTRLYAAPADSPSAISTNWAGYVVSGPSGSSVPSTFASVTGTWTQPKAVCSPGKPAYSATWVGLGGFDSASRALEQIGTSADCNRAGKVTYYAWYEVVPAPEVKVKLVVAPGDTITTSVNVTGQTLLVQIKNRTRHTSFTKQLTVTAPDLSSAEWIEEAPAACTSPESCRVLPLANFGSVAIRRIATIGSGHPGTILDPTWQATRVQLVPDPSDPSGSTAGASPSDVSVDGRSFGVSWQQSATAAVGG